MERYFYSNQINGDKIILPKDEAIHALKVLRKQIGEEIKIVDGRGNLYIAIIKTDDILECLCQIQISKNELSLINHSIHIAISPPKSHDRVELFVEKAIEIGIQEISFILTNYSDRNNIKLNRIEKCSISAMKQSLKSFIPKINDIVSLDNFIKDCQNSEKFVAHLGKEKHSHLFFNAIKNTDYCVLIGPEGGFNEEELQLCNKYGYKQVSLGSARLRSETAAIVACNTLNIVNEKKY